MARLLADENFPFPVVEALRRAGHDLVTVADAGKAGQALTLNRRHFLRLHAADPNHAGIIVCSLDLDFDAQAARISQAIAMAIATQESLAGCLIRVNRPHG